MSVAKVLKMIKDKEVKFITSDLLIKESKYAQTASTIDENTFKDGIMFDDLQ